jgi:hypothetical protein
LAIELDQRQRSSRASAGFQLCCQCRDDPGDAVIACDDLDKPIGDRRLDRKANGDGKRIEVHTVSGKIVMSGTFLLE